MVFSSFAVDEYSHSEIVVTVLTNSVALKPDDTLLYFNEPGCGKWDAAKPKAKSAAKAKAAGPGERQRVS